MNSDQLYYLIEISKSPSLNMASQKLHITPQALSTAIKKLEDELGFELLNRSFKGISLTGNGEWLVQEASLFLNKIEEKKEQHLFTKNQTHRGELSIAINYSGINNNIVGQLVGSLYEEEPDLRIKLKETSKDAILEAIMQQTIELGFIFRTKVNGAYIDHLDSNLDFEPLFCGNLVLMTAPSTELAKFNSITLKKIVQHPLCVYNPNAESKDFMYYLITDIFNFPVQYSCESSFSVYREKLRRGIANTLSVYFTTEQQPNNYVEGMKIVNLRDDIKIFFGFVRHQNSSLSENGAFFLERLRDSIAQLKYPEK